MKEETIRPQRLYKLTCLFIICAGSLLRITVFLQNRNLILDEVNLVRNLQERKYLELLKPLSYGQFAPIPFLFISKLAINIFGTHEWAVRLYPFICGVLAPVVFYKVIKKLNLLRSGIYPLFLMVSGDIYLRYATEFKQYAQDELICICLVWLAITYNPRNTVGKKLLLIWTVVGSIALWLSMPAIFVLAGIGVSFLWKVKEEASKKIMGWVWGIGCIWFLQFLANYFLFLREGTNSGYLQQWHSNYFLCLMPLTANDWTKNASALCSFWGVMGGYWVISFTTNIVLLCAGIYFLAKNNRPLLKLLLLPIGLLFVASGLHQYTLLPRVSMFAYPLLLLVIGMGLQQFSQWIRVRFFTYILVLGCIITMYNFNSFKYIFQPLVFERTTDNISWINSHVKPSTQFFVDDLCAPQYQYYLSIAGKNIKNSDKWVPKTFYWNTNMDSLCLSVAGDAVFAFGWLEAPQIEANNSLFNKYFSLSDSFISTDSRVYLVTRKI